MAKLIDSVRSAISGAAPLSADEIERRLAVAEATAAQLVSEHHRAALAAESGDPGGAEQLSTVTKKAREAADRVSTLRGALTAARENEELSRRKLQAKLRKDNLARVAATLELRDQAAERLAKAIEDTARAWREVIDLSEKAALPIPGVSYPTYALTSVSELRREVERELFRVSAVAQRHHLDFPGARAHDLSLMDQPETLPALVDVVKEASAYVNKVIRGDALEQQP